jgi:putative membrane protein
MIPATPFVLGILVLVLLWLGPLPGWAAHSFSAHMLLHMGVVAVAAPLIGLTYARRWSDAPGARLRFLHPVPASVFELVVVWAWHTPALHHAAQHRLDVLFCEQAMFLAAGLWLWSASFAGIRRGGARVWMGVAALWFTSIHMTLLGAIFALAPRALYMGPDAVGIAALADQHLGGGIMLLVGGVSYLAGGLWLAFQGLGTHTAPTGTVDAHRGGLA